MGINQLCSEVFAMLSWLEPRCARVVIGSIPFNVGKAKENQSDLPFAKIVMYEKSN